MSDIEKIINDAWEIKDQINKDSDKSITDAVKHILKELDQGKIRVAEKVNGEWVTHHGETYDKINPADLQLLGQFPLTDDDTVGQTVAIARNKFSEWKRESRFTRSNYMDKVAQILERRKEEVAKIISLETGKNYNESIAEVNEAIHMAQLAFGSGRYPHGEAVSSEIPEKDAVTGALDATSN